MSGLGTRCRRFEPCHSDQICGFVRIRKPQSRDTLRLFSQYRRCNMGAWSVSITGNDTAEDLKSEYQAAFFYYDIETALSKIDKYVRAVGFDESDEEE